MARVATQRHHNAQQPSLDIRALSKARGYIPCACGCGQEIPSHDKRGRPRRFVGGHACWKGGRRKHGKGYILVFRPEHPAASRCGCVYEHRLVMEKVLGRLLTPEEVVHHIDGDPANNAPENLDLFESAPEHLWYHRRYPQRRKVTPKPPKPPTGAPPKQDFPGGHAGMRFCSGCQKFFHVSATHEYGGLSLCHKCFRHRRRFVKEET